MIPIIDIARVGLLVENDEDVKIKDYKEVGNELYKALSTIGFAYLKNSGMTDADAAKAQLKFHEFFRLNDEIKSKFNCTKQGYGYIGIGKENLASSTDTKYGETDYKQAFNITGTMFDDVVMMSSDTYVVDFSKTTFEFCDTCAKLSRRVFKVLSYGLKLKDVDFLAERHSRMNGLENYSCAKSSFYPPITDDLLEKLNVRLGSHSDYGSLTFLFQDDVGGLQVQNVTGEFIDAPYIPDTVIMNIGDIMNLWTEGRLKSTVHRVIIPEEKHKRLKHRASLAYFSNSNNEVPIEIMEYNEDGDPPRPDNMLLDPNSGPTNAAEWIMYRFNESHNIPKGNVGQ